VEVSGEELAEAPAEVAAAVDADAAPEGTEEVTTTS